METFIGPYVPPQNLTKDALKAAGKGAQGAFAATISNAVIKMNAAAGATGQGPQPVCTAACACYASDVKGRGTVRQHRVTRSSHCGAR